MRQLNALFILVTPFVCPAQKGMLKGFFVLPAGDTIQGLVKLKSLDDFTSPIVIVEEKSNEEKLFLPEQIKSVSLMDSPDTYFTQAVALELSYIDSLNLMVKHEGITVLKVLLLQKIYAGTKLDLYYYHTRTKDFYFVHSNGKIEQLLMRFKTNETRKVPSYENLYRVPTYIIQLFYRDQLLQYFDWHTNKSLALKVNELTYEKAKILAIIKEIDRSR